MVVWKNSFLNNVPATDHKPLSLSIYNHKYFEHQEFTGFPKYNNLIISTIGRTVYYILPFHSKQKWYGIIPIIGSKFLQLASVVIFFLKGKERATYCTSLGVAAWFLPDNCCSCMVFVNSTSSLWVHNRVANIPFLSTFCITVWVSSLVTSSVHLSDCSRGI